MFQLAHDKGVGVLVRSILLQGALTARAEHLPAKCGPLIDRSRRFRTLVAENLPGLSPAQVAIAFGLAEEQIGSVLVGMRSEDELQENLQAVEARLPTSLLAELRGLRLDDSELLNPGTWFAED